MEKLFIVKIGGGLIDNAKALDKFLTGFASIQEKVILVHGGGKILDDTALKLGIEQMKTDGRRITTEETRDLAVMIYAGLINKKITASLLGKKRRAVGLSGADASCILANKRENHNIDFGFVGDPFPGGTNEKFINILLDLNFCPVFSSITVTPEGELLNTNADTVASVLAVAMTPYYKVNLIYCFDKAGVINGKDNNIIPTLNKRNHASLLKFAAVSGGMIPKLNAGFSALESGAESVFITNENKLSYAISGNFKYGTVLCN